MKNVLGEAESPYLLQHKNNPLAWQVWSADTLKLAQKLKKPILLSVGYASCHWCHVMAKESFCDPQIARLAEKFVAVKVDREERPEVDMVYQIALQAMGEQGGWPLTMFLTPQGEPFWGGTYFPPRSGFGRPSFGSVLLAMDELWRQEPGKVRSNVAALKKAIANLGSPQRVAAPPAIAALKRSVERLSALFDRKNGGIGKPPKFPQTPLLEFLWEFRRHYPEGGKFVLLTARKMCQGGIFDHLGGGFARYSVDERWLAPHFEKMLYDNGQLLGLLARLYKAEKEPLFASAARLTVEWLETEMEHKGCWSAALDADSKNAEGESEEGAFYTWKKGEIDEVLAEDAPAFAHKFGVSEGGNWEGKNILHSVKGEPVPAAERQKLLRARRRRSPPGRDDKILTDSNGIAIYGLTLAAESFGRPDWLGLAERGFAGLCRLLVKNGRLFHCHMGGKTLHSATLDDYAHTIIAACGLFAATAEKAYLKRAEELFAALKADHKTTQGYAYAGIEASRLLPVRIKPVIDSAIPSGNGALLRALRLLAKHSGKEAYETEAKELRLALGGSAAGYFPSSAAFFCGGDDETGKSGTA